VFSGEIENIRPTADEIGKAVRIDDALGRYIEYAKTSFPRGMTLEGLRIIVDCAHGAAYKSTPCVLRELGAEVIVYGNQPDGKNINKDCGSMHPSLMCQKIWEHRADLGIAHDGDADRVLLCDEKGTLIDGDDIMAIAALDMLAQGTLAKRTVVSTVMSNAGLEAAIAAAGGSVVRTAVGDKQVIDEMLREGYNFGGEQSGHIIFRDYNSTGDGWSRRCKSCGSCGQRACRCPSSRGAGPGFRNWSPTSSSVRSARSSNWTNWATCWPRRRPSSKPRVAACFSAIPARKPKPAADRRP